MRAFPVHSIRQKLTAVILMTAILALALASLGFGLYERASYRKTMINELATLADTLGANTAAALMFHDSRSASDILSALRGETQIVAAFLYDQQGRAFAEYRRPGVSATWVMPAWNELGARFDEQNLTLVQGVSFEGTKVGTIVIASDLSVLHAQLRQYTKISVFVLVVSVLLAFLVSSHFLQKITSPILQLSGLASKVSSQKDYSLRADRGGSDEVGLLVDSFNQMLVGIQQRDAALRNANDELESRVEQRTEELRKEVEEHKRTEAEMRRAKEVAEEANRAKSEFLANMSHEIRTPLNGVMGMTDLALGTQLTTEQREYLETVKLSADSLLIVINDILDFSKIEAGKAELENRPFNLRDTLEGVMRTLALRADEKGLELLCELAPETPELARGDSSRLGQVVLNLVGNAIKFTHEGEVGLKVDVEERDGKDRVLHFVVSDTGIGIPAEKHALIFDPFAQADTSTTRKYGGTGLGLSISTRLIRLMGGKIWLESEEGKGSRFHFTTRLGLVDTKEIEVGTPAPAEVLHGVRVLVVDDNRTNLRILDGMLKRWEMKPTLVEGGEQALLELLAAKEAGEPYGLILLDMHMPKMDGFQFVERIRERPELSTATIMMLTSAGHRGDAERCKALGISAYLLKPIRQSELREAIARVLGAKEQQGAIPLITRYSLYDARDPESVLRVLLVEDNPVNQRLATRMLEKRGHRVVLAGNGREALEALAKGSFDLVLMDVQMPEMDGFQATAAIREMERSTGAHLPVVALTAHAIKGDRERCLAAGMDGYLTKPIRPRELDDVLENYLALRAQELVTAGSAKKRNPGG
jgi:two-component system, sensor histidine kinase and response regulator